MPVQWKCPLTFVETGRRPEATRFLGQGEAAMEHKTLPESELEVMLVLWKANRPMTRGEIEEQLHVGGKKHWAPSTVLSLLYRLIDKGYVVSERPGQGKTAQFAAAMAEQEYLNRENHAFLSRWYDNSVAGFVSTLHRSQPLRDADVQALRQFLDGLTVRTDSRSDKTKREE